MKNKNRQVIFKALPHFNFSSRQFQDSQIEVFVQVITQVYKMESAIANCSVVIAFKERKRHYATGRCTQKTMAKLVDG